MGEARTPPSPELCLGAGRPSRREPGRGFGHPAGFRRRRVCRPAVECSAGSWAVAAPDYPWLQGFGTSFLTGWPGAGVRSRHGTVSETAAVCGGGRRWRTEGVDGPDPRRRGFCLVFRFPTDCLQLTGTGRRPLRNQGERRCRRRGSAAGHGLPVPAQWRGIYAGQTCPDLCAGRPGIRRGAAGGSPRPGGFGCGGTGPPAGRTA